MVDDEVTSEALLSREEPSSAGAFQQGHEPDLCRLGQEISQILGVLVGVIRKC